MNALLDFHSYSLPILAVFSVPVFMLYVFLTAYGKEELGENILAYYAAGAFFLVMLPVIVIVFPILVSYLIGKFLSKVWN